MQCMSESVFVGLCEIVGTSQLVALRRETVDIREMVKRRITPNPGIIQMLSGSVREGFRLKGSDKDTMFWPSNHRVIMDMSQSEYYNRANTVLILSESSESPPGFTLLQLLTPRITSNIYSALVRMNDRAYISSSIYRHLTVSSIYVNSTEHGPCGTGKFGGFEYDTAMCFICDSWPSSASSWIDRCHSWPNPEVVHDIVRNGCHFVAIGHPLGIHENEEWRISFSQAEYKLVYSMNHCQFLTYGLLKIFLKEVIDQQSEETNKLLCSYHMKTTVFWVIQKNIIPYWCPQNLLAGFWVCFKLLLKWVYKGICPNFFIPQNNMFLTKINGPAQNRLFLQLHELYNKGLACLLQSSSIRSFIIDVLYIPRLFICTNERLSEVQHDYQLVHESNFGALFSHTILLTEAIQTVRLLKTVEQLVQLPLTHYQALTLQRLTVAIFQSLAFITSNMYTNTGVNKQMYIADKLSCHMLKLATKFGLVSDMLYIAMYYYRTLRYREASSVLEMTEVKLARPYLMYDTVRRVDRQTYTEALGGQSLSTKMRQAVAEDITLYHAICYISELIPEQQSAIQNKISASIIPVFLMIHFLDFLCYRHIDTTLSQAALDELQVLVHHDQGLYIFDLHRDISWEILGICQQMAGNLQDALYSYQQSLTQHQINGIQTATHMRIRDVVSQLNN